MTTPLVFLSLWSVACAIALAACDDDATAPAPPSPPTEVAASEVVVRDIHAADELTGRVEAIDAVEIRPRVSGYITGVRFREGAEVAAGDLLYVIDPRPYRAVLSRATAELARARARLELARTEVDRAARLLESNAIARAEHDSLMSGAAQADAEVQAAKAAVELARLDVEFTEVRAPIAGRVGESMVSTGDFVAAAPAPPLTTVVSLDPVHVYFSGSEQLHRRISAGHGSRAAIGLSGEAGFPHEGEVDFVDNRVDPATGTIRARAVLPNPDRVFTPGLFARVKLRDAKPVSAVLVEDRAVLTDQDRKYVYAVGAGDTAERRDIKLGSVVDGLRVVTAGLRAGDRVIVSGTQKVFPGARVAIKAAQPAAGVVR